MAFICNDCGLEHQVPKTDSHVLCMDAFSVKVEKLELQVERYRQALNELVSCNCKETPHSLGCAFRLAQALLKGTVKRVGPSGAIVSCDVQAVAFDKITLDVPEKRVKPLATINYAGRQIEHCGGTACEIRCICGCGKCV